MTDKHALSYVCFEDGCGLEITAADEDTLITVVNQHMHSAHNTFELDEVILSNSTALKS